MNRGQALATNFVSDFRRRFPDLAQRRSDNGIADGGAGICNAVVEQGITKEIVLRRLSTTFDHDGSTLNTDQSLVLFRMPVFGICPERRGVLRELTG